MNSRALYLLTATFPLAASFVVLAVADVSKSLWLMHLLLIATALLLIVAGRFLERWATDSSTAHGITLLTLSGLAAPLLYASSGPQRWIALGPLSLYVAPVLLPSFLAASAVYLQRQDNRQAIAFVMLVGASILLALQPDASQVLALLAASTLLFVRARADLFRSVISWMVIAYITYWAFTRPDPLAPVPHVEGVFALALGHSLLAGCAVIASALVFIAALYFFSLRGQGWLAAVAAYYAVLFVCSVYGLTPAPLIGFGAGPLLGFGLMTAISGWIVPTTKEQSDKMVE